MNVDEFNTWVHTNIGHPHDWGREFIAELWRHSDLLDMDNQEFHALVGQWLNSEHVTPKLVGQFLQDDYSYMGREILHQTDDISLLKKGGVLPFLSCARHNNSQDYDMRGLAYLVGQSPKCFSYVVNSEEFRSLMHLKHANITALFEQLHKSEHSAYGTEFLDAIPEFHLKWVTPFIQAATNYSAPLQRMLTNPNFIGWAKTHEKDLLESYTQLPHTHANLVLPLLENTNNWNTVVWGMVYHSQKLMASAYNAQSTSLWMAGLLDWIRSVSLNPMHTIEILTCKWNEGDHETALVGQHALNNLLNEEIPILCDLLENDPRFDEVSKHIQWRDHPRVVHWKIQRALEPSVSDSCVGARKKM